MPFENPSGDTAFSPLCISVYLASRYAEAAEAYRHKRDAGPWVLARLAACYGQMGKSEECRATVAELLRQKPDFRLSLSRRGHGDRPTRNSSWT